MARAGHIVQLRIGVVTIEDAHCKEGRQDAQCRIVDTRFGHAAGLYSLCDRVVTHVRGPRHLLVEPRHD